MVHSSDIFDIYPPNRRATPAPSPSSAVEGSVLQPRPRLATATSETGDDHRLSRNSLNLGVNRTRTSQGTLHRAPATGIGDSTSAAEGSVSQPRLGLPSPQGAEAELDDHLLSRNSLNLGVNHTRTSQGTPHRASTTAVGESPPAAEGSVSKSRPRLHSSQDAASELDPLAFRDSEASRERAELAARESTIAEAIARSLEPPQARDAILGSD